jgi:hypothetical protein
MTDPIEDLWPDDLIEEEVDAPVVILRKQADFLSAKTKGMLTARVQTSADEGLLTHTFIIVAPSLDDYTYELFIVMHDFELYPVTIQVGQDSEEAQSKEEYLTKLRTLFGSLRTKRLIRGLLVHVAEKATSGPPEP